MNRGFTKIGAISSIFGLCSLILYGITSGLASQLKSTTTGYLLFMLMLLLIMAAIIIGIIDLAVNKSRGGAYGLALSIITIILILFNILF